MQFSDLIIPLTVFLIILFGLFRGVSLFDIFLKGAKNGLNSTITILPSIVGLVTAVSMLKASGAIDLLCHGLSYVFKPLGFPSEVLPLAILRPVSGGASLAILNDILNSYGPDSFAGRVASVISGSTETTFYTLTVYFAATHAKDSRYTLKSALLADATGILLASVAVHFFLN
ncbi:MAG: spore maturation protein [Clostridia bacterium]|nr:spore maturation protein [Clostridia bacterium]